LWEFEVRTTRCQGEDNNPELSDRRPFLLAGCDMI
jgi:hypothetical protein